MNKLKERPKCWICEDMGLVIYKKTINEYTYEMGSRCSCEKGVKTSDRIPIVETNLAEKLAMDNYNKYN